MNEQFEIHLDFSDNEDYNRNPSAYLAGVLLALSAKISATSRLEGVVQDLDGKDCGSYFPK